MAARHGNDGTEGRLKIVVADGAVGVHGAREASMIRGVGYSYANIAFLVVFRDIECILREDSTLQWWKSFPIPSPLLQMPQSRQW